MEKNLKLYILGEDRDLLNQVVSKVNKNRPVEAVLFHDLKEFLATSMSAPPDLFALSMDFPHPKISRFPKVLKMAMNLPVIVFPETTEPKSRKGVSLCQADYKISGKLTAHNLWMKILNFQREEEQKNEKEQLENNIEDSNIIGGGAGQDKNPLASLFNQLGGNSDENLDLPGHQHLKSQNFEDPLSRNNLLNSDSGSEGISKLGKNSIHVKSSEATKFHKKQAARVSNMIPKDEFLDDEKNQNNSFQAVSNPVDPTNNQNGGGKDFDPNELNSLFNGGFFNSTESSQGDHNENIDNHIRSSSSKDEEGKMSLSSAETDSPSSNEKTLLKKQSPAIGPADEEQKKIDNTFKEIAENKLKKSQSEGARQNLMSAGPITADDLQAAKDVSEDKNTKKEKDSQKQVEKINSSSKGSVGKAKGGEEKQKTKEERQREFKNKVGVLEEACKLALPEVFPVEPLESSREFELESLSVFSINQSSFKGYILFANSFNHKENSSLLIDMQEKISNHLSENGMVGGLGSFFEFKVPSVEYPSWSKEICEFTVQYEDDSGKQFFLNFLPREKVLPPYSEVDENNDMIRVDLQHIPPNTPVDFDAFIHLPLNKRYVRYLKKERSICLDQAKRLMKDTEHKRLFVPKSEKQKFIQFYIKNSIYWEIMSYRKQNVA